MFCFSNIGTVEKLTLRSLLKTSFVIIIVKVMLICNRKRVKRRTLKSSLLLLSHFNVSDSMRPHRLQPTSLPRPWDSPGKNTGVGCHFLLQCVKVKSEREFTQLCPTLYDPMDCSLWGSSVHGIFQARVLEWGCHCLLQKSTLHPQFSDSNL